MIQELLERTLRVSIVTSSVILQVAESIFRRLKGTELLPTVFTQAEDMERMRPVDEHVPEDRRLISNSSGFWIDRRNRSYVRRTEMLYALETLRLTYDFETKPLGNSYKHLSSQTIS